MNRIVTAALLMAAFLMASGAAQAQVATTDLVPGQSFFAAPQAVGINGATFTPHNPAALAWGQLSVVGVGGFDGSSHEERAFNNQPTDFDFQGKFAGARFIGDTLAFAADYTAADGGTGANEFEDKVYAGQISLKVADWFSVGVGREHERNDTQREQGPPTVLIPQTLTVSGNQVGVSLDLGQWFFIGAAKSRDTLKNASAPDFEFKRDSNRGGIGIRTLGDWHWYAEYYVVDSKPFTGFGQTQAESGFKTSTGVVQLAYKAFMVGYAATSVAQDLPATSSRLASDIKFRTVDVAWAGPGLTVALRGTRVTNEFREIDTGTGTEFDGTDTDDTTSVSLGWQF